MKNFMANKHRAVPNYYYYYTTRPSNRWNKSKRIKISWAELSKELQVNILSLGFLKTDYLTSTLSNFIEN
jgi:hypothetical protein